jgi:hypothetical protein
MGGASGNATLPAASEASAPTASISHPLSLASSTGLTYTSRAFRASGLPRAIERKIKLKNPILWAPFFFLVKLYMIYLFIYLLLLLFFQGFTIGGQPVFDHFLKVKGTFELATNASVQSPPTLMIHLRLKNLPHLAHFTIVHELLAEYYHESEGRLQVLDMPFAIENDEEAAEWTVMVTNQLRMLRPHEHAVVFITTHSDPDRGDLWTKKSESPHEEPCAVTVSDVSSGVFYQIILILIINSTVALYNPWPFFCQA